MIDGILADITFNNISRSDVDRQMICSALGQNAVSYSTSRKRWFQRFKAMSKVDITSQFSWRTFRPVFDVIRPGK